MPKWSGKLNGVRRSWEDHYSALQTAMVSVVHESDEKRGGYIRQTLNEEIGEYARVHMRPGRFPLPGEKELHAFLWAHCLWMSLLDISCTRTC
jgi:hypothetical protein